MKLTRENVLSCTHYGIKIYAFVLRQYYPGETVISLKGRTAEPVKNPFNHNKPSLHIEIEEPEARHRDDDMPSFKGDALQFAACHFRREGEDLLRVLNEQMHLRLEEEEIDPFLIPAPEKGPEFSFFKRPVTNTTPAENLKLGEVYQKITGPGYEEQTLHLRELTNKKEARALKARAFDYVTFSGVFSKRSDKHLLNHSGLIAIDFDDVDNLDNLRSTLLNETQLETQLLFTSPSGNGLKWIVPIDLTVAGHLTYFTGIGNYLRECHQLEIDPSGKDVSRACFLCHDSNAFINPKYL